MQVVGCSLPRWQLPFARLQVAQSGTGTGTGTGCWLLAAGCLVSCLSRWRGSHVACLLGSQGKRKTFACLPLARAAEGEWGKRMGERGRRRALPRMPEEKYSMYCMLFSFCCCPFSAFAVFLFMQFTWQTTRYFIVYLCKHTHILAQTHTRTLHKHKQHINLPPRFLGSCIRFC